MEERESFKCSFPSKAITDFPGFQVWLALGWEALPSLTAGPGVFPPALYLHILFHCLVPTSSAWNLCWSRERQCWPLLWHFLSISLSPRGAGDLVPLHSATWNRVCHFKLEYTCDIWIPRVPAGGMWMMSWSKDICKAASLQPLPGQAVHAQPLAPYTSTDSKQCAIIRDHSFNLLNVPCCSWWELVRLHWLQNPFCFEII